MKQKLGAIEPTTNSWLNEMEATTQLPIALCLIIRVSGFGRVGYIFLPHQASHNTSHA